MEGIIQIALVGKQPMPVLIPILQYRPPSVHLIYSPQTRNVANNIRTVCKSLRECQSRVYLAEPEVSPYNSAETKARCADIAKAHAGNVVLNITSGTTPMNLGALRAAQQLKLEMIYVDTDDNQVLHLDPDGRENSTRDPIAVQVAVETYVNVHGAILTNSRGEWTANYYRAAELLGSAGTGSVTLMDQVRLGVSQKQDRRQMDPADDLTVQLAWQLQALGVLADVEHAPGGPLCFRIPEDADARDFSGKWLEVFVAERLRNAGNSLDVEKHKYVRRHTEKGMVENDIDVLVTRQGRLAAISCKTGRLREETEGAKHPIYELDSVLPTDLMGLYCKKILVTNRPSTDIPDSSASRALLSKIKVLTGDRLNDIAALVSDYLMASAGP